MSPQLQASPIPVCNKSVEILERTTTLFKTVFRHWRRSQERPRCRRERSRADMVKVPSCKLLLGRRAVSGQCRAFSCINP